MFFCVRSSFVAQVFFFLHVSRAEFEHNSILDHALLASIRMFEHKNPLSHELAMNFLILSHALMCAFLIYSTSLLFPSCLTRDFENQVFSIPYYRYVSDLWSACLNIIIQYHTSQLWSFWFTYMLLCLICYLWHKFSYFFIPHTWHSKSSFLDSIL